jgi:predicted enzyme related to lactoylglutathione lyase
LSSSTRVGGRFSATDDVDQAVWKARKLGGQVLVPPTDIPEFGCAVVLKDPEGAFFGIFQKRSL